MIGLKTMDDAGTLKEDEESWASSRHNGERRTPAWILGASQGEQPQNIVSCMLVLIAKASSPAAVIDTVCISRHKNWSSGLSKTGVGSTASAETYCVEFRIQSTRIPHRHFPGFA
ncbi:hypothetical protein N658DRAFT_495406 [Parathielavia hyrcaniae]|uniref:Uncharacterized protein n=1 Tax=Parathielavia hyrcaniae TaxID=113614 RepID=A0AAN6T2V4_9PEZI|nr:hypothetical protein N658DRAFT_495406 [Parathielavia hyrcaniae]